MKWMILPLARPYFPNHIFSSEDTLMLYVSQSETVWEKVLFDDHWLVCSFRLGKFKKDTCHYVTEMKIVFNFFCISSLYIQLILYEIIFVEVLSRLLVVYLILTLYISNIVNIMFILFQGVLENIRGSVGSGEKSGKKLDQSLKRLLNVKFLWVF